MQENVSLRNEVEPIRMATKERVRVFSALMAAYEHEIREGKKAELALVGLWRYGREWMRGGEKGAAHLCPALFVRQTTTEEDRRFKQDIVYQIPGEEHQRFLQLKSGASSSDSAFVRVSAPALIRTWERVARVKNIGQTVHDLPDVYAMADYHASMKDVLDQINLDKKSRRRLEAVLFDIHKTPS